jgi:hypothetical protein
MGLTVWSTPTCLLHTSRSRRDLGSGLVRFSGHGREDQRREKTREKREKRWVNFWADGRRGRWVWGCGRAYVEQMLNVVAMGITHDMPLFQFL